MKALCLIVFFVSLFYWMKAASDWKYEHGYRCAWTAPAGEEGK